MCYSSEEGTQMMNLDQTSPHHPSPPSIPTISTTNQRDSSTREGKFTLAKTTFSVSRQKGKLKINIKLSWRCRKLHCFHLCICGLRQLPTTHVKDLCLHRLQGYTLLWAGVSSTGWDQRVVEGRGRVTNWCLLVLFYLSWWPFVTFVTSVYCAVTSVLSDSLRLHGLNCQAPAHGVFQARTPEWVAISSSRGSSWPRKTRNSYVSFIGRQVLYHQSHLTYI